MGQDSKPGMHQIPIILLELMEFIQIHLVLKSFLKASHQANESESCSFIDTYKSSTVHTSLLDDHDSS